MNENMNEAANMVERLMPDIINYGLKVLGAFILFFVGRWLGRTIQRRMLNRFEKRGFDKTLTLFFSQLVGTGILILTIVACLGIFGVQTASLAALLGGAALAIGLAFQGSLSNFAAGIMLVVFRPFKVGDYVEVAGVAGTVHDMGIFATQLDTPDNRRIIVPNGAVFGATIVNVSHHPIRRVDVSVGTDYSADLEEVRRVLEAVALSVPGRLQDRVPQIYLAELGASSIDWQIRIFAPAADFFVVRQATILLTKRALDKAGIGIPFPQMDVHLDKGVDLTLDKGVGLTG